MTEALKPADPFADIRPYHDDEVPAALERLINDVVLLAAIAHFRFPRLSRYVSGLVRPLIRRALH